MRKNRKGFTLIELLVVIAIIGLLSTLAVVALNNAREKSRDARRVADVKQIQTALELFYNDESGYPLTAAWPGSGAALTGPTSGVTYMSSVPAAPTPPAGNVYTYTAAAIGTYQLVYTTEGSVAGMDCTSGCTATPAGIND